MDLEFKLLAIKLELNLCVPWVDSTMAMASVLTEVRGSTETFVARESSLVMTVVPIMVIGLKVAVMGRLNS